MNVTGLTSAVSNLRTAETLGQIQVAVAAKMLKTANEQGQAVLSLIEAAAQGMEQAVAQVSSGIGANLDVAG